jgi:hypothetical protein
MNGLTRVELVHYEGQVERWIRFGVHVREDILDRRRRALWFATGAMFAFVRWAAGDYGTAFSRIDIVRACAMGEPVTTVPGVAPGGEVLLRLSGWPKVERTLEAIDQVEALGLPSEGICPDHWRHVQSRLAAGETPRAYTLDRHRAWRLRQRIDA